MMAHTFHASQSEAEVEADSSSTPAAGHPQAHVKADPTTAEMLQPSSGGASLPRKMVTGSERDAPCIDAMHQHASWHSITRPTRMRVLTTHQAPVLSASQRRDSAGSAMHTREYSGSNNPSHSSGRHSRESSSMYGAPSPRSARVGGPPLRSASRSSLSRRLVRKHGRFQLWASGVLLSLALCYSMLALVTDSWVEEQGADDVRVQGKEQAQWILIGIGTFFGLLGYLLLVTRFFGWRMAVRSHGCVTVKCVIVACLAAHASCLFAVTASFQSLVSYARRESPHTSAIEVAETAELEVEGTLVPPSVSYVHGSAYNLAVDASYYVLLCILLLAYHELDELRLQRKKNAERVKREKQREGRNVGMEAETVAAKQQDVELGAGGSHSSLPAPLSSPGSGVSSSPQSSPDPVVAASSPSRLSAFDVVLHHDYLSPPQRRFVFAVNVFFALVYGGGLVFARVEGWNIRVASDFCLTTLATIGYGNVSPATTAGRCLLFVYFPLGFASLGFAVRLVWQVVLAKLNSRVRKVSAMLAGSRWMGRFGWGHSAPMQEGKSRDPRPETSQPMERGNRDEEDHATGLDDVEMSAVRMHDSSLSSGLFSPAALKHSPLSSSTPSRYRSDSSASSSVSDECIGLTSPEGGNASGPEREQQPRASLEEEEQQRFQQQLQQVEQLHASSRGFTYAQRGFSSSASRIPFASLQRSESNDSVHSATGLLLDLPSMHSRADSSAGEHGGERRHSFSSVDGGLAAPSLTMRSYSSSSSDSASCGNMHGHVRGSEQNDGGARCCGNCFRVEEELPWAPTSATPNTLPSAQLQAHPALSSPPPPPPMPPAVPSPAAYGPLARHDALDSSSLSHLSFPPSTAISPRTSNRTLSPRPRAKLEREATSQRSVMEGLRGAGSIRTSSKHASSRSSLLGAMSALQHKNRTTSVQLALAFGFVLVWIVLSTYIFSVTEEWSFFHSFYFCYVTLTTIGFGDVVLNRSVSSAFFLWFIVFGMGAVLYVLSLVAELLTQRFEQRILQRRKVKEARDERRKKRKEQKAMAPEEEEDEDKEAQPNLFIPSEDVLRCAHEFDQATRALLNGAQASLAHVESHASRFSTVELEQYRSAYASLLRAEENRKRSFRQGWPRSMRRLPRCASAQHLPQHPPPSPPDTFSPSLASAEFDWSMAPTALHAHDVGMTPSCELYSAAGDNECASPVQPCCCDRSPQQLHASRSPDVRVSPRSGLQLETCSFTPPLSHRTSRFANTPPHAALATSPLDVPQDWDRVEARSLSIHAPSCPLAVSSTASPALSSFHPRSPRGTPMPPILLDPAQVHPAALHSMTSRAPPASWVGQQQPRHSVSFARVRGEQDWRVDADSFRRDESPRTASYRRARMYRRRGNDSGLSTPVHGVRRGSVSASGSGCSTPAAEVNDEAHGFENGASEVDSSEENCVSMRQLQRNEEWDTEEQEDAEEDTPHAQTHRHARRSPHAGHGAQ